MDHVVNHAEYSCPVASYQLVECFGVTGLASFHQVQFRHIGLRQSPFLLHDWTEPALFHSTLKAVWAKTAAPLSAIFTHQAYDPVPDFEESLLQHQILRPAESPAA